MTCQHETWICEISKGTEITGSYNLEKAAFLWKSNVFLEIKTVTVFGATGIFSTSKKYGKEAKN